MNYNEYKAEGRITVFYPSFGPTLPSDIPEDSYWREVWNDGVLAFWALTRKPDPKKKGCNCSKG